MTTASSLILFPVATNWLPSYTFTSIRSEGALIFKWAFTVSKCWSISGVIRSSSICLAVTGSSQTVCQMPVTGVYQIPSGLFTCLPLGWYPSSVGSQTFTTNLLFPLPDNAAVISKENGVKPPVWLPTFTSFTQISAFQSTAPKWSNTFLFFQATGTSNEREYHNSFFAPTLCPTPDKEDSTAKGTKICPSKCPGTFPVIAYSHKPFKFFHSLRSIIGRGYSGNTAEVFILFAHCVLILSPAGFHCAHTSVVKKANNRDKIRKFFIIV